ncbi:MAG: hypothetical protein ABIO70_24210 [Pseudomonadota bacterium]
MIKILLLLVIVGAVGWIWLNRRGWLLKVLGRAADALPEQGSGTGTRDLAGARRQEVGGGGPLVETPRALSPLEVPTIQARFEKLGIWKALNEYQAETLRRLVLEACREGRVALWWSPLAELARHLDYSKGEVPVVIMDARLHTVVLVRRNLLALDYLIRGRGLQIDDVRGEDEAELEADKVLEDGRYWVVYRVREHAYRFPLTIAGGQVDVHDLVGRINGLLARRHAADRLLLLPPEGAVWCVVCCVFSTAEQVHRAGWGQLTLPKEGEEDPEGPSVVVEDQ